MCDITNCLSQTLYSIIISLLIFNLYYYSLSIFYEVTTSFDKNSTRTFFILVLLIGFVINPLIPEFKHSLTLLSSANAVKAIIGLLYCKFF